MGLDVVIVVVLRAAVMVGTIQGDLLGVMVFAAALVLGAVGGGRRCGDANADADADAFACGADRWGYVGIFRDFVFFSI